jgi:hypothetical protein
MIFQCLDDSLEKYFIRYRQDSRLSPNWIEAMEKVPRWIDMTRSLSCRQRHRYLRCRKDQQWECNLTIALVSGHFDELICPIFVDRRRVLHKWTGRIVRRKLGKMSAYCKYTITIQVQSCREKGSGEETIMEMHKKNSNE